MEQHNEIAPGSPEFMDSNEAQDPNVALAHRLLYIPAQRRPEDIGEIYANSREDSEVTHIEQHTGRPSVNTLYLSELLIGHQDSAVDFYQETLARVQLLPEEMRPDTIIISGLMQGDFKHIEKTRRSTLVPGLDSMDAQFKYARQLVEQAVTTGASVIYNMSNDDRRIAEEYTIEVFKMMNSYEQNQPKDERGESWASVNRMKTHPEWNKHLQFQTDVVFPYCLKNGRRLRTADEMASSGAPRVEEYFMLVEHLEGTADYNQHLDLAALEDETFLVVDDFDITYHTESQEYNDSVRHFMGYSTQPMYQNHLKTPADAISQLVSNGERAPDMLITQHNQEEVGVGSGDSWIISTGGLIRAKNFLKTRGLKADAAGDVSRRLATSRRRIPSPSASMHERTDDGRHIVTLFNEKLNEKSYSLPERLTIAEICDLQTGSITARPDMLAKYIDYIRTKSIGERATAIFFGGDMIHGRNYPHFPAESQSTGLMAMDSQVAFNKSLFRSAFKDMTAEELAALEKVVVQIGNHEWNSGTTKWHGYSFSDYMRDAFEKLYIRGGYSDEEIAKRVKFHDAVMTQKGEVAQANTSIEYFGDIGVLIQHYLLERGGKGSGGNAPVYQTHNFATGAADLMKNIDIFMAGHWHHPQYGVFGDKVGIVGGSMAGLSGYELWRGYRPSVSGTLLHIGGGLPTQIEFVGENALHNHKITTGEYSDKSLKAEKYKDDRDFDAKKHGIFLPDRFAKSALQKKLLQQMRDASQRVDTMAEFR